MSEENATEASQPSYQPNTATAESADNNGELDFIYDIGVNLTFAIGSKKIKLKELVNLKQNSVIELDKAAGDPIEIFANGSLVAKGEVVIVNERYGIRLIEVVSKQERIKNV